METTSNSIADLAFWAARVHGSRVAIRYRRDDGWQERSFAQIVEIVRELALGLVELGIEPGDRVCVLADTRPEWTYLSLAIAAAGAVVVPIYPTNSPEECEWVAGNSGARAAVCENAAQLAKIEAVRARLGELETVIAIEPPDAGIVSLQDLRERGRASDRSDEFERRRAAVAPGDPCVIIYTSGTTGPPKGCVLTHGNLMTVCDVVRELDFVGPDDSCYLYLPLAHVFAQLMQFGAMQAGSTVIYFGGDTKRIVAELAETGPTCLPSVPRIFEKLYTAVTARAQPEQIAQAVKVGLAARAAERSGTALSGELQGAYEQADELLFEGVRAAFGGRMRQAVSGAAPIAPDILEFFYAAGVPVLEGYGMTETTGIGTVNLLDKIKIGSVGRASPGIEVRIADDGEILMRGPNIFAGYWQNPEATAETLGADGWLRTGDLGELDADGFLRITGRKKDIIITAGGKNLAPANIENDLKQSRWISQAVMHGDRRPFPVALITLDPEEIVPWARERGLPEDMPALAGAAEVRDLIQAELEAANAKYAQVEQIKKFTILDHDLAQETGELTPTLKVKRNVVNERYAGLFDAMYA
jgi:long-chain acyl-CoA synthetase